VFTHRSMHGKNLAYPVRFFIIGDKIGVTEIIVLTTHDHKMTGDGKKMLL